MLEGELTILKNIEGGTKSSLPNPTLECPKHGVLALTRTL